MKRIAILIIGGLLLSGIIFIFLTQKYKKTASPATGAINNAPTSSQPQIKTYADVAGFSFKYPESLTLSEKEFDDESIYAWVELTDPKNKNVISVKLEDSDLAEIDDWFTASNKTDIKGEIKEIELADINGRQFTGKENQLTTLALDEGGVLISISGNPSSVHQQIISSFIFTQDAQSTNNTSNGSDVGGEGDIIFEGEEVIE